LPTDGQKENEDARRVKIAERESANGLKQTQLAADVINYFLEPDRPFALRPSLVQLLQSVAVEGLLQNPGEWRGTAVSINGSEHQPPPAHLVETLVQEMCDYVNDNLHEKTALHLAAYVMWRLNWIHPFLDGNGRTTRAISYIVLCSALKVLLPGTPSIPQQIQENRSAYFHALVAADEALRITGNVDVSVMEEILKGMLAKQLLSVIEKADGSTFAS